MRTIELQTTLCPICNTKGNATELYAANFDLSAFSPRIFSARRLPDRIHYRVVMCNSCGLVRSDPIADPKILAELYARGTFDYDGEAANLKFTYGKYLSKLHTYGARKVALLEIGCGEGFFLEEALKQGYSIVRGVEPSTDAVAKANPQVRPHILCDIMRPGLFEEEQFDVVCMFQVLDHIPNPDTLLDECFRVMKPGGLMLCINHNIKSLSSRLLKSRCPIIDIEHTYLYDPITMVRIVSVHNFQVKHVGPVLNRYNLHYILWLTPLPVWLKPRILAFLKDKTIGRIRLSIPLGNLYLIAQKPTNQLSKSMK